MGGHELHRPMAKSISKNDEYSSTGWAPASKSDIDIIRVRSEKSFDMKARWMRSPAFVLPRVAGSIIANRLFYGDGPWLSLRR